jgi:CRP/FNR family transcriptional regulator
MEASQDVHPDPAQPCPHNEAVAACVNCRVRNISVCAALKPHELHLLSSLATDVTFSPRSSIVEQGIQAHSVYNITSGTVRTLRLLPDGRRQIFGFLIGGDFLGLSMPDRYPFAAEAIDEVRACRFARADFEKLLADHPQLMRLLFEATSHELSIAQETMLLIGRRTAEERVSAFLVGHRDRLRRIGGGSVTIPLAMTRQDIADHLGLTIETVSRTFSKFVRDRLILIVPDGVRILDTGRLEALSAR